MKRKNIRSGSPFEDKIGFSRAVRVGSLLVISGTAPIKGDGSGTAPMDLYQQTNRCLEIIEESINAAGAKIENVVRTRLFLKDITQWEKAALAHSEYFSLVRPASTFVEVSGFIDENWLVEIEADCIIEQ